MAIPSNPSFGSSFNEQAFRDAIKSTMQMGSPNAVAEKATFTWETLATVSNPNSAGQPFDFNQPALTVDQREEVLVDCAVEFVERSGTGTAIGQFENPRVVITLLDEDYELVRTASKVKLGGNSYTINYTAPPVGLFAVTVYSMYATADDES